ncbi:MAG: cytochrome c-type biogenesis protein CcmH [Acidobacteriota bacterium]
MLASRRVGLWIKGAQALLLAVAVCFSLGATDASGRVDKISHQLMCTCGCSQLLGECDHAGCPNRDKELAQLTANVSAGMGDQEIFDGFVAKYGATVLAAPTKHGFDLVAWIAPFAVFGAALLGTILLVRHWSVGKTQVPAGGPNAELDPIRERIRRETGDGEI